LRFSVLHQFAAGTSRQFERRSEMPLVVKKLTWQLFAEANAFD
jgi:hypothetical protein